MKRNLCLVSLTLTSFCFISSVHAHPGGLDSYGCHNETATRTYHCHQGRFEGRSFDSKDAMLAAWNTESEVPEVPSPVEPVITPAYSRDLYRHWIDADRDCQDTRQEVLIIESLTRVTLSSDGCRVVSGTWYDPFTGQKFTDPSLLDIDHLVPLEEAHNSGGYAWDADLRRDYANDLLLQHSLIAVSASANRSKGARDPSGWLPSNTEYHCEYVKNWVEVKNRFGLSMDSAERSAIANVIGADVELAARVESRGWNEVTQRPSTAIFGLGIRRANECGYTRSARPEDNIVVSISVTPEASHLNQAFSIYLVAEMGGALFNIDKYGSFTPFDGSLGSLVPFTNSIVLNQNYELEVFSGVMGNPLTMKVYLGYGTEGGDFVYTSSPILFEVEY